MRIWLMAFALLLAFAPAAHSAGPAGEAQDLLQSSCFRGIYKLQRADGLETIELEWFDVTDHVVSEAGDLLDESVRSTVMSLAPNGPRGRRFFGAHIAVRLRTDATRKEIEGEGALCLAEGVGLRCRLSCEAGGGFRVERKGEHRIRVVPDRPGLTLNACAKESARRLTLGGKSGALLLRRRNYDLCGGL